MSHAGTLWRWDRILVVSVSAGLPQGEETVEWSIGGLRIGDEDTFRVFAATSSLKVTTEKVGARVSLALISERLDDARWADASDDTTAESAVREMGPLLFSEGMRAVRQVSAVRNVWVHDLDRPEPDWDLIDDAGS